MNCLVEIHAQQKKFSYTVRQGRVHFQDQVSRRTVILSCIIPAALLDFWAIACQFPMGFPKCAGVITSFCTVLRRFQWNRQRLATDSHECQVRVGIWSGVQEVAVTKFNSTKSSTNIKIKYRHCGASMAIFDIFCSIFTLADASLSVGFCLQIVRDFVPPYP
jgi:hypothetical protein